MVDDFLETVTISRRLPANRAGRDFVIGDIHGMADQVDLLLKAVNFNEKTDRLFLVGDLADRGPKSVDALRLVLRPYVHAAMGNHEKMLLCAIWDYLLPESNEYPHYFECKPTDVVFNGAQWLFGGNLAEITENWYDKLIDRYPDFPEIIAAVARLPLVLTVGDEHDRFHVLHAELPNDWTDENIDQLPATLPLSGINKETKIPSCCKRTIFLNKNIDQAPPVQDGLSLTFTGHTIGSTVRQAYSHINIDTGAFKLWQLPDVDDNFDRLTEPFALTMINAKTLEVYRLGPQNRITRSVLPSDAMESADLDC